MQPTEQRAMKPELIEKITKSGVVAVIVIDEVSDAVPLARALLAGGIDAIELTLRTPAALDAASTIINEVPDMTVGIGTVLTIEQLKAVAGIGAAFGVAPGCNPRIVAAAQDIGLSFAPGIATPSDIEKAVELGCRILKYFPAETLGGMKHLTSMAAPYQYLGLRFIPLGGLNLSNAGEYLESPLISAIGGSWIAKRQMIRAGEWDAITKNSMEITRIISEIRNNNQGI
jgi:2-dehydro-3-deoxyphosphogluconate aldolase/(4S)-4-hydroxy-2-oxoglutarate aldolase